MAQQASKAVILQEIHNTEISSASAIEYINGEYFIAGDDSPWLYILDQSFSVKKRIKISADTGLIGNRIPKSVKADYESMVHFESNGKIDLFLFGSGTTATRNSLLKIDLQTSEINEFNLTAFYNLLKQKAAINDEDLNIEGACSYKYQLILLNRGTNTLFMVHQNGFKNFIEGSGSEPVIKIYPFNLPVSEKDTSRFSGVSLIPGSDKILFCASTESTTDWINDGEIGHSYVGIIDLNNLSVLTFTPVYKGSKQYKGKIESLVCLNNSNGKMEIIAVTDNDNGSSDLIKIEYQE